MALRYYDNDFAKLQDETFLTLVFNFQTGVRSKYYFFYNNYIF